MARRVRAEEALSESLSESDRHALRVMRKELWTRGLQGGAAGFLAGIAGFAVVERIPWVTRQVQLKQTHRFATPLFTGALGLLFGSLVSARNNSVRCCRFACSFDVV